MAKDEELNKWTNSTTPRRVIKNFCDNATPVDSPDLDNLLDLPENCVSPGEVTYVTGSSQCSQRSRVHKRKLFDDEEQPQGNASKKNNFDETQTGSLLPNDSMFGTYEFPSRLESPSLVILPRPNQRNKKRMSVTAFANAIQSQQSHVGNTSSSPSLRSSDLGELSIPSVCQNEVSQRSLRSKKCTSVSMLKEPIGGKKTQEVTAFSGLEESGPKSSGITTLQSKRSSESIFADTNFEKTDLGLSGKQQTGMTIGPRRSIRLNKHSKLAKTSFETSSKASDSEMSEKSSMPKLESPNEFFPVTSLIQITKSKQSKPLHSTVELNRPSDQSQKGKSISTTPPIPSASVISMTNSWPSSRASSNSSSSLKASKRSSTIPSPESGLLLNNDTAESHAQVLASSIIAKIKQSLRSATQTSAILSASSKSSDGTTRSSKSDDSDLDELQLNKTPVENTGKIPRSTSQASKKTSTSSKSSAKATRRSKSESEPENSLSRQITDPTSTKTLPSSVIAAVDEAKSFPSLSSSGSRTRKSLKYGSSTTKEASSAIQTIVDNQPSTKEDEVGETLSNSSNEKSLEEEKSTDEIEEEEEPEELSAKSRRSTHCSRASSKSSRKSEKNGMNPSNRYPDVKNSTVIAGGAAFSGAPFLMSPIRPGEQGAPLLVLSTPKSKALQSFKAGGKVTSTNVKSLTPKTVKETTHPSTPAPSTRKRTRSTPQSPMFMNVMKSSVKKAIGNIAQNQQRIISAAPITSTVSITKNVSSSKGLSISNSRKGKSLVKPALEKIPESSDSEWEDESEQEQVKPRCVNIALEEILEDRSKDFVPLEKRLLADPVFQAKVKTQRAKVAAQKAAEEEAAAAAKKNETKKKPRTVAAIKKEEDNIANVATNKGNLRFYARTKVPKEALDAVHGLVGEWLDFTLEQMENFCIDEGKPSLDSWEDCYKMIKRQGIVKNYMDYSGLCHELLLNDECAPLLPSRFPPEYYDCKREAKRQKK